MGTIEAQVRAANPGVPEKYLWPLIADAICRDGDERNRGKYKRINIPAEVEEQNK